MIISEIILVVAVIVAVLGYLYEKTKITKINPEEQVTDYDPLKTVKDLEEARRDIETEKRNYQSLLEKTRLLRDEFKKKEEFVDFLKDAKKRGKDNIVLYEIEREMIQDKMKRKSDSFVTFGNSIMSGVMMEDVSFHGEPTLPKPYATGKPLKTNCEQLYEKPAQLDSNLSISSSKIDKEYLYENWFFTYTDSKDEVARLESE